MLRVHGRRHIRWSMNAKTRIDPDNSDEIVPTLGGLLYDKCKPQVTEDEWVRLVRATAGGDSAAFGNLYMLTNGYVFTLLLRIVRKRTVAETLTVDVFHEVWLNASAYSPASGSVVGWIMNLAQGCARKHAQREGLRR
jgi:hypothetical protein